MKLQKLASVLGIALAITIGFNTTSYADDHEKSDALYISDAITDTVKRFDATTGQYLGDFVPPGDHGLHGPMGVIITKGDLYLVNQNVNTPFAGEIMQYDGNTGKFINVLVDRNNPDAPFAPRGIIRGRGNTLYVADVDGNAVKQYDLKTGKFLGNFDTTGFNNTFLPRGIVQGPDDLIYVAARGTDNLTGYVLRFDAHDGKFVDVFTSNTAIGCATHLHRPEGLVFGPDEKLYITASRTDASDTDKVLIFDGKTGECLDKIDLAQPTGADHPESRAFAQALLFGPNDRLFVPITGPQIDINGLQGTHTGEVRSYNVKNKTFKVVIPAGGVLQTPEYMTFGKTDARTLEYDN